MNRIAVVFAAFAVFFVFSCKKNDAKSIYERFESFPFGISVNEGREILKKNKIAIVDETAGTLDSGESYVFISVEGKYYHKKCYIQYGFANDKFMQGHYQFFSALQGYSDDGLEEIKLFLANKFKDQFGPDPELFNDGTAFFWTLENKMQVGIMKQGGFLLDVWFIRAL